jgi:hypothetical protein
MQNNLVKSLVFGIFNRVDQTKYINVHITSYITMKSLGFVQLIYVNKNFKYILTSLVMSSYHLCEYVIAKSKLRKQTL